MAANPHTTCSLIPKNIAYALGGGGRELCGAPLTG
jgi:hypothetical protein